MPDAKPKNELGIIFIINYFVFTDTKVNEIIHKHISDVENGFFNLGSYSNDETIKYCFIVSIRALDDNGKILKDSDPSTKIFRPTFCKIEQKYKLEGEIPGINLGNINLGNYDVLSTTLIMVRQMLNSDEYIIITYSHGGPFGTGNASPDKASEGAKNPFLDLQKSNNNLKFINDYLGGRSIRAFDDRFNIKALSSEKTGISILEKKDDDKKKDVREPIETFKPDMLTNAEEHVAFVRAFSNANPGKAGEPVKKSIKLIISCACYVQNVDTLFSLHQVADYIVAASSSIPELTFDFATIINDNIANKKNKDYRSIAENIIEHYNYLDILKPIASSIQKPLIKSAFVKQDNYIVLSAIDCKELSDFFKAFNNFILLLISQVPDEVSFKKLKTAKEDIVLFEMERIKKFIDPDEDISPVQFYMYDLKMFITSFIKHNPEFSDLTKDLTDWINNKIVIKKRVSPELVKKSGISEDDWGGLSFYFPDEIDISKSLIGLSKFYSVFSDLESFLSQKGYVQEFIFLYHKRDGLLNPKT